MAADVEHGNGERQQSRVGASLERAVDDLLRHSEWLPTAFGYVTNTAVSLASNGTQLVAGPMPAIVDSTYASVWGNLGIPGGVFFALFLITWCVAVICTRRLDLYVCTLIFGLYGLTMILFEAYPMNLLLAVCTAFFLRRVYVPFWTGSPVSGVAHAA